MILYDVYYRVAAFDRDIPLPEPSEAIEFARCTNGEKATLRPVLRTDREEVLQRLRSAAAEMAERGAFALGQLNALSAADYVAAEEAMGEPIEQDLSRWAATRAMVVAAWIQAGRPHARTWWEWA